MKYINLYLRILVSYSYININDEARFSIIKYFISLNIGYNNNNNT